MAKKGMVHLNTTIQKMFGRSKEIKGEFEVTILEEDYNIYHVEFKDQELEHSHFIAKYVHKDDCRIIES